MNVGVLIRKWIGRKKKRKEKRLLVGKEVFVWGWEKKEGHIYPEGSSRKGSGGRSYQNQGPLWELEESQTGFCFKKQAPFTPRKCSIYICGKKEGRKEKGRRQEGRKEKRRERSREERSTRHWNVFKGDMVVLRLLLSWFCNSSALQSRLLPRIPHLCPSHSTYPPSPLSKPVFRKKIFWNALRSTWLVIV